MTTSISPVLAPSTAIMTGNRAEAMGLATGGISVMDTISKGDIVAVIRQEAEERLAGEKIQLDRRLRDLEGKVADIVASITKQAQALVEDAELKDAKDAAKALQKFTGVKYETRATLAGRDDEKLTVTIDINIFLPKNADRSYEDVTADRQVVAKYTPAMIDEVKQLRLLQKDIAKLQTKLMENKKGMAALPALERKATAELTKQTLMKSQEGQALLDKLRNVRPLGQE